MNMNEQAKINAQCLTFSRIAAQDFEKWHANFIYLGNTLAQISRTNEYVVLRSRSSIVALFHISSGIVVDILRYERGWNRTSAQHIVKFCELMDEMFGISEVLTYRGRCENKENEK